MEMALEQALGQLVVAKSARRDLPERLAHAYEAFRTRSLRGSDMASVCSATVDEP